MSSHDNSTNQLGEIKKIYLIYEDLGYDGIDIDDGIVFFDKNMAKQYQEMGNEIIRRHNLIGYPYNNELVDEARKIGFNYLGVDKYNCKELEVKTSFDFNKMPSVSITCMREVLDRLITNANYLTNPQKVNQRKRINKLTNEKITHEFTKRVYAKEDFPMEIPN